MTTKAELSPDAAPARGLYFGWRVVAALFLATFALFGVSIYSFIILTAPIAQEYHWSPAEAGSLVSAMWLAAPLSLFLAPAIRWLGPWRLLTIGFVTQAVVMAMLPLISAFWQLYALRIVMGCGKIAMVVCMPVILTRWFSRRFATAMAIVWAGGSAGGMVLSPLTEQIAASLGWRTTSLVISAGIVCLILLVGLLVRGVASPSQLGLRADGIGDGDERNAGAITTKDEKADTRKTLSEINWLTAATMLIAVVGAGVAAIALISQEPAIMEAAGISPAIAAVILGLISAAAMVGAASIGWILDRFPAMVASLSVAFAMFSGLLAFFVLPNNPNPILGAYAALAVGYAVGSGEVLWMDLTKRQFGEAAYATTYGGWYLALQIGYATGGGLAGLTFGSFGTTGFLLFVALVYLPAGLFSLWRPRMRQ